mmetsp:Transcript_13387/g.32483  ORF Transcript_13387/g.32483 Transcript_13387/m.32483 type:complete len:264 (+) Transcript_13387:278-1069(+)
MTKGGLMLRSVRNDGIEIGARRKGGRRGGGRDDRGGSPLGGSRGIVLVDKPKLAQVNVHVLCAGRGSGGGGGLLVGDGRVVEENAHVVATEAKLAIAESVLHLAHLASLGISEEIVAHGDACVALHVDGVVVEAHVAPGLDGEAAVLADVAVTCSLPNEVGQRVKWRGPELLVHAPRGLEEHGVVVVGVELARRRRGKSLVVTALHVRLAHGDHAVSPRTLRSQNLILSDRMPVVLLDHHAGILELLQRFVRAIHDNGMAATR